MDMDNELEQQLEQQSSKIAIFRDKQIRKTIHQGEWYFSIIDIIAVLADSQNPRRYWSDLKIQLSESEGFDQLYGKIVQLKLLAPDGKMRKTDTTNTETIFRIIQSIPSSKAEPFKRWLAKIGYERIQEIEDPELAAKRGRAIYKAKGYPDDWIEKRMRGIAVREQLTNEWEKRGVKEEKEYAILTAEIADATFGLKPSEREASAKLKTSRLPRNREYFTSAKTIGDAS